MWIQWIQWSMVQWTQSRKSIQRKRTWQMTTLEIRRKKEKATDLPTKETGNHKGSVHAVTYDENNYSWDATSSDTGRYPQNITCPIV